MLKHRNFAIVAFACLVLQPSVFGQRPGEEIPGAVRMNNGLILKGICGRTDTISPLWENQRLELRVIEQRVRAYYISTRQSESVSPDNQVVPRLEFKIPQRRISNLPMQYQIGAHYRPPFDAAGRSYLEMRLPTGESKKLELGIKAVNSKFVTVQGLTHPFMVVDNQSLPWEYWIDISQIPDTTLYAAGGQPCLLRLAKGFSDGDTQLNMAQMLLDAEKFVAAQSLIADIRASFPDLADNCNRLEATWNDSFGQRVVDELKLLRDTGKYVAAKKYARLWPDGKLDPAVKVRANLLQKQLEEDDRRVEGLQQSISGVLADIKDDEIRREAMRMWSLVDQKMSPDNLDRFGSFELFADKTPAESRFALAMTGWLLGGNDSFDNFVEAAGLFQIRELLISYLQTEPDQLAERNSLVAQIRQQEGFSVDRVATILKSLPPVESWAQDPDDVTPSVREIDETPDTIGGMFQLPSEYSSGRKYPTLIAAPREGVSVQDTIAWWSIIANRKGYVLLVPELLSGPNFEYGASAVEHLRFRKLLQKLKAQVSIDDDRVFIAGHGVGGEAAMDLATSQPDLFAGVISLGGRGRLHIQWTAHNSMSLPWYIVVGTRQPSYYPRMESLMRKLFRRDAETKRHSDVLFARYRERGFEPFAEELPTLFDWMELHKRELNPVAVDATILRSTDTNWWWLQLQEVPQRFTCLEAPSTFDTRPTDIAGKVPGNVSARLGENLIRIASIPADGFIRLSPDLPGIDLNQPISLRIGTKSQKLDYEPSVRDMLEDFYENRDRSRLCYMKIPIEK